MKLSGLGNIYNIKVNAQTALFMQLWLFFFGERFHEIFKIINRHRFCKVVALEKITSHFFKSFVLLNGLDALCKGDYAQLFCKIDDILDDSPCFCLVAGLSEELHVYLHDVNGHIFQHIQR